MKFNFEKLYFEVLKIMVVVAMHMNITELISTSSKTKIIILVLATVICIVSLVGLVVGGCIEDEPETKL